MSKSNVVNVVTRAAADADCDEMMPLVVCVSEYARGVEVSLAGYVVFNYWRATVDRDRCRREADGDDEEGRCRGRETMISWMVWGRRTCQGKGRVVYVQGRPRLPLRPRPPCRR